ncbi:MAG: ice-binding family protein [Rectinemataceae bacterium]
MKKFYIGFSAILLLAVFLSGCAPIGGQIPDTNAPTVSSVVPADAATDVIINGYIAATFDEAVDPATVTTTTFTLTNSALTPVSGTVILNTAGTAATLIPGGDLAVNTSYIATITTGVMDLAGNALASDYVWTFSTGTNRSESPAPVGLGTAGNFVILSKAGISTTGTTAIDGDIGVSPAAQTYLTGFSETLVGTYATASMVTGKLYAADMDAPTPGNMTTAISAMETAFVDAAGRSIPDFTELGAGDISGMTLVPGLYKWGTGVLITDGVTLAGNSTDVWIFQIAENLTVSNGSIVTLIGGALPKNVFWQVSGKVTLGTTSDFKGIILCQTNIAMQTNASIEGRMLAQTAVTLDANTVTEPAP